MATKKRKAELAISTKLIAPCGMNCRLCLGYLREKIHVQVVKCSVIKIAKNRNTGIHVKSGIVNSLPKVKSSIFIANTYPINFEGMTGLPCRVVAEV
jgi:hypothetical protein